MPSGMELDVAIAAEETRLAELDRLSEAARGRLLELRVARERAERKVDDERTSLGAGAAWSAERKVALFASLFRGREDVFRCGGRTRGRAAAGGRRVARMSGFEAYARSRV